MNSNNFFIQTCSLNFLFHYGKDFFHAFELWKWKDKKRRRSPPAWPTIYVKEISFLSCCDLRDNIWTLTRSAVQMLDAPSHLCSSAATDGRNFHGGRINYLWFEHALNGIGLEDAPERLNISEWPKPMVTRFFRFQELQSTVFMFSSQTSKWYFIHQSNVQSHPKITFNESTEMPKWRWLKSINFLENLLQRTVHRLNIFSSNDDFSKNLF